MTLARSLVVGQGKATGASAERAGWRLAAVGSSQLQYAVDDGARAEALWRRDVGAGSAGARHF